MSQEGLDSLIDVAKPDLVFVTEGSETLTSDQVAQLQQYDIDIYYLPRLTSAKRIRFAVKVIGMTLAKGGVEGAESAYNSYLAFEESLVAKYASNYNGGMTGGFDFEEERDVTPAASTTVTLLVDKWDDAARHESTLIDSSGGVAVSTLGYGSAPVSYYMSVGGGLNNAASKPFRFLSGSGIVWQFAPNELDFRFNSWSGIKVASYDLSAQLSGGVFTSALLWNNAETASGFGTPSFPAIVAKSKEISKKISSASKSDKQLYYAYPVIHPSGKGSAFVEACIGRMMDGSSPAQARDEYRQVLVNPRGLCQQDANDELCSWVDGSLESVLESSWVYWKFRGGSEAEFRQDVIDFYSSFYGYDVSADIDSMLAGAAS